MEPEKTLLQQIREKEREYAERLAEVRAGTDAALAAAKAEAETLLCTADAAGQKEAEQYYWQEKARTESEVEALKQRAAAEREAATARGERNLRKAIDAITGFVTTG